MPKDELLRLRDKIESVLDSYLAQMTAGYDDSVTGFNDAWNVITKVLETEIGNA